MFNVQTLGVLSHSLICHLRQLVLFVEKHPQYQGETNYLKKAVVSSKF